MCILLSFKGKKERKCKCKCELLLNLMSLLTTSAFLCPLDSKTPPKGGLLASTSSLTCLFLHLGSLGSCAGPEGPSCKSPAAYIHRALRFSYSTSGLGGPPQGRTSSFLKRWRPRRTAVALGAPLQPGHHARRLSGSAVICVPENPGAGSMRFSLSPAPQSTALAHLLRPNFLPSHSLLQLSTQHQSS